MWYTPHLQLRRCKSTELLWSLGVLGLYCAPRRHNMLVCTPYSSLTREFICGAFNGCPRVGVDEMCTRDTDVAGHTHFSIKFTDGNSFFFFSSSCDIQPWGVVSVGLSDLFSASESQSPLLFTWRPNLSTCTRDQFDFDFVYIKVRPSRR